MNTQVWPTTALQTAFLVQQEGQFASSYIGQGRIDIAAALEPERLKRALEQILEFAPQLRAGFLVDEDLEPVQFVNDFTAEDLDFSSHRLADAQLEASWARVSRQRRLEPFHLDRPALVRWDSFHSPSRTILLVSAHHAVMDAWSMRLLVDYLALALSQDPFPQAAPYQEHLAQLQAADKDAAQKFWQKELTHLSDQPLPWWRLAGSPGSRIRQKRLLDEQLFKDLTQRAQHLSLSLAGVLQAAFALTLDWLTGQNGTAFVVPVHGRNPEIAGITHTLGLLTDSVLAGFPSQDAASLDGAIEDLYSRWQHSQQHQHLGLSGILTALASKDPAQVLFAVEHDHGPSRAHCTLADASRAEIKLTDLEDSSHYPLMFTVLLPAGQQRQHKPAQLQLDFDDQRVDRLAVDGLLEGFIKILQLWPQANNPLLADLDLRTKANQELCAQNLEQEPPPGSAGDFLGQLWEQAALKFADRPALSWLDAQGLGQELTFAQMDEAVREKSQQLSDFLINRSCQPHPLLVLDMPRSLPAICWIFAAMRLPVQTLVINHALPEGRKQEILAQLNPALIITDRGLLAGRGSDLVSDQPLFDPADPLEADSTVFVVLTSGSTGLPKPVAISQQAMAQLVSYQLKKLWQGPKKQVAHSNALHFDAHWDALLAIFAGHQVFVFAEDLLLDTAAMAAAVAEHSIDYLDLGPALWAAHLKADQLASLPPVCVAGGENFPPALWNQMRERSQLEQALVINAYGPTENTVDALAAQVAESEKPVVGRTVGATRAYILDRLLRPVALGAIGELYLAGQQLAQGYLGMPAVTASRFVAAPKHLAKAGQRLYRTGDLARMGASGLVELLGRSDDQLSINGYRIEPGEVAAALLQVDGVDRAHVGALEHPLGGRRLLAWIIGQRAVDEVEAELSKQLPAYMVPRTILKTDHFPVTSSGKLDSAALPQPAWSTQLEAQQNSHETSEQLAALADAAAKVLGGPVKTDLSLVAAGGDSISAVRICAGLSRRGYFLAAAQLINAPTLAAAGRLMQASRQTGKLTGAEQVNPREQADSALAKNQLLAAELEQALGPNTKASSYCRLSGSQLGIYIDALRAQEDPYRTLTVFELSSPEEISDARLKEIFADFIGAHPVLSTVFIQGQHKQPWAVQVQSQHYEHIFLAGAKLSDQDLAALDQQARTLAIENLDLNRHRLLAPVWLRQGPGRLKLYLGTHHLLADGWSNAVMANSLEQLLAHQPLSQDLGWFTYLNWLEQQDQESWRELWRQHLAQAQDVPDLLTQQQLLGSSTTVEATWSSKEKSSTLADQLKQAETTLASLAQAAWALSLAELTGSSRVCYGLTSSGRDLPLDLEQAMGSFISTRPVYLNTEQSTKNLLASIKRWIADTEYASHLGAAQIRRETGVNFCTLLVVQNYPLEEKTQSGQAQVRALSGQDRAGFPVALTVAEAKGQIKVQVELNLPQAQPAWAQQLLSTFLGHLYDLLGLDKTDLKLPQPDRQQLKAAPWLAQDKAQQLAAEQQNRGPAKAKPKEAETDSPALKAVLKACRQILETDIGADQDLFASGADSIAAMQLVGLLRQAGYQISIASIFTGRTARALAQEAQTIQEPALEPSSLADKDVHKLALPAALRWYCQHIGKTQDPFIQARLITIPAQLRQEQLAAALKTVLERHQSLRLAVTMTDDQPAQLKLASPYQPLLEEKELAAEEPAQAAWVKHLAGRLDPDRGRLFFAGRVQQNQLLLVAHHLGVDAISWPIIIEDLKALCQGRTLAPAQSWVAAAAAEQAAAQAYSKEVDSIKAFLTRLADQDKKPATTSVKAPGPIQLSRQDTVAQARRTRSLLPLETSAKLLKLASSGYSMDLILAAATAAGLGRACVVEFESHGRLLKAGKHQVDWSSVVGWWTKTWQVPLPSARGKSSQEHLVQAQRRTERVKKFFDQICLTQLHTLFKADILVNYLGKEGQADQDQPWHLADSSIELEQAAQLGQSLPISHPLEVNASLVQDQLTLHWQLAPALADQTEQIIDRALAYLEDLAKQEIPPAEQHLPLDLLGLSDQGLQTALEQGADGIWPLTPAQTGIALQSLPAQEDPYLSWTKLTLTGELSQTHLAQAVTDLASQQPQLRLRLGQDDQQLYLFSHPQQQPQFKVFKDESSALAWLNQPLNLHTQIPLRWALIQAQQPGEEHQLIFYDHHLILDGWSVPVIIDRLFSHYRALIDAEQTQASRKKAQISLIDSDYCSYLLTHSQQQQSDWYDLLPRYEGELFGSWQGAHQNLSRQLSPQAAQAARKNRSSLAEITALAWATVLAAMSGQNQLMLGTVVSGRDQNSQSSIGMFLGTIPLAFNAQTEQTQETLDLLTSCLRLGSSNPWPALTDLAQRTGKTVLFDTLIVLENYPKPSSKQLAANLVASQISGQDDTHYPFALTADIGAGQLSLDYPASALTPQDAESILLACNRVLSLLADSKSSPAELISQAAAVLSPRARACASQLRQQQKQESETAGTAGQQYLPQLQAALAEILHTDEPDPQANFFALGADSITAMSLVSHLKKEGLTLTPADIFANPVLEQLARHIRPLAEKTGSSAQPTIQLEPVDMDALNQLIQGLDS